MSTSYIADYTRAIQRQIVWDKTRTEAAKLLAVGHNKQYVADEVGVCRATIYNWLDDPEFACEVDRLSTMMDVASRAERLRGAMRVLRSLTNEDGVLRTDKDALDWLKYAQSETDGAKIDLSKLAELLSGEQGAQAQDAVGSGGGERKQLMDQSVIEMTATTSDNPDNPDGPSISSSSQSDELDFNPS